MKMNKIAVLVAFLSVLLAITVASQIALDNNKFEQSKVSLINKITLEEKQECETVYYNETIHSYGNVTKTRNTYGTCFNATNSSYYTCVNGTENYQNYEIIGSDLVLKNRSDCKSKNSFVVTTDSNGKTSKKEIDFSGWGICIQETENNCLAIICGSLHGGSARNGIFNGCDGGKSCQKFLFCENEFKVLYKASRQDFVEQDPTYHLPYLAYKEVEK